MPNRLLPEDWEVPQRFRDRLGTGVGRQRVMVQDDHLLLILHRVPDPDEEDRRGRLFWRSPEGRWRDSDGGEGVAGLIAHLDEYERAVEAAEQRLDAVLPIEEHFAVLELLGPIDRSSSHQLMVMEEARDQVERDPELIDARDLAYKVSRMAELAHQAAKNSLDHAMARRAERQAESSHAMSISAHRLNVLAALFFPVATLTAIFGVNLEHGWEEVYAPLPFLVVMIGGLLTGVILSAFISLPRSSSASSGGR